MGEVSRTVGTAWLLERTLTALFGHKTVPVKMFRGKGRRDPMIPASYFATDRLRLHPEAPINRMCAERVVEMVRIAPAGESGFDRFAISRTVGALAREFFGVGVDMLIVEHRADELLWAKIAAQIDVVRCVMGAAVGLGVVDIALVAGMLREIRSRSYAWAMPERAELPAVGCCERAELPAVGCCERFGCSGRALGGGSVDAGVAGGGHLLLPGGEDGETAFLSSGDDNQISPASTAMIPDAAARRLYLSGKCDRKGNSMEEEEWPEIDKTGMPHAAWWRWCVEGVSI